MDRRERAPSLEEVIRSALDSGQSRLWTAMVGVVQDYDANKRTCTVQPAVNGKIRQPDGSWVRTQLPLLKDCPVQFPCGGGVTLTFPVALGDECLVVFSSRCIDTWYARGFLSEGASIATPNPGNDPPEYRMHNLSDGFALMGFRSLARQVPADPVNAVLTSDDGGASISLNPTTHAVAIHTTATRSINASGGITMNGATIDASGNVSFPGTFAATGITTGGGVNLDTHTHTSTTPGDPTSPPLPTP
jgi:hypothetical protein